MRRTRIARILAGVCAVVAVSWATTACATTDKRTDTGATGASPSAAAYPVTVGSLTLTARPEHIISLSPTATEMLFAVGAGAQVAAVDDNSNYPAQAPKTSISAYKPNAEAIVKYQPDLVVLSNDMDKIVAQLSALKIPTFLAPAANTIDDTYAQIRDIGILTGHRGEADTVVRTMRDDITAMVGSLTKRTKPLTYYYELDPSFYSVTSTTFVGSLFASAGLVNIADPAGKDGNSYPQLSAEAIVGANPDFVFLADTKCCGQSAATVAKRAGWSKITAVTRSQVVALDDDVASRWGPRVVDLFRAITDAVAKAPAA